MERIGQRLRATKSEGERVVLLNCRVTGQLAEFASDTIKTVPNLMKRLTIFSRLHMQISSIRFLFTSSMDWLSTSCTCF
jgi:hypothetical protein